MLNTFLKRKEAVSKVLSSLFLFGYLMESGSHLSYSEDVNLFLIHPLPIYVLKYLYFLIVKQDHS
ncbi:hypothetical protein C7475_101841 [Chitinophaga sp. S165]|nr:hypothetical protein C7475_101841 [Chitinophaga sp. S165]